MSVRRDPTLWCDRCGEWLQGPDLKLWLHATARELRRAAKRLGWRRVGSEDLCPACVQSNPEQATRPA